MVKSLLTRWVVDAFQHQQSDGVGESGSGEGANGKGGPARGLPSQPTAAAAVASQLSAHSATAANTGCSARPREVSR